MGSSRGLLRLPARLPGAPAPSRPAAALRRLLSLQEREWYNHILWDTSGCCNMYTNEFWSLVRALFGYTGAQLGRAHGCGRVLRVAGDLSTHPDSIFLCPFQPADTQTAALFHAPHPLHARHGTAAIRLSPWMNAMPCLQTSPPASTSCITCCTGLLCWRAWHGRHTPAPSLVSRSQARRCA